MNDEDRDPQLPLFGPSDAAKALGARGASKGGRARAKKLSPERRSEIARQAIAARWHSKLPRASHNGVLRFGNVEIPCAVLEDGQRVITQQGFLLALGRSRTAKGGTGAMNRVDGLPAFVAAKNLKPFVDKEITASTVPLRFTVPSGGNALGYKAELVPQVCNVYRAARTAGALTKQQLPTASMCDILAAGLGEVGIVALIDEATGHQYDRARYALAEILEAFVAKELRKWARRFPTDFYRQIFRLRGWAFREGTTATPRVVGKFTNNLVWSRLAPGVLDELKRKNPTTETGRRKHKHFQWLTHDIGDPKLKEHIVVVTEFMRAADSWDQCIAMLDRVRPKWKPEPLFDKLSPRNTPALTREEE